MSPHTTKEDEDGLDSAAIPRTCYWARYLDEIRLFAEQLRRRLEDEQGLALRKSSFAEKVVP